MPLGHWNWKWNQARSNYSTYDQELLAGMLVLSSQSRLLGSNPIVWSCDQEPVKSFQKGPPPEKAKLKLWWTYLSQFRLTVHDALIGESSEALAREAFQRMDVQLDLSMRTAGILEGWSLTDYQSEYEEILQTLSTGLEPSVIDGHQWYKNNQYLFYEDRIVVPEARVDGCLQWSHLSSGHNGANCSVDVFRECFYSSLTLTELRSRMQTIVDACGCHASKQSDSRDTGLISSLPIPYCANPLLYVDFIHGLPRFGGYDSCLVVTCGLSRFTRVFPCNRKITSEQNVKMLVEQWFGAQRIPLSFAPGPPAKLSPIPPSKKPRSHKNKKPMRPKQPHTKRDRDTEDPPPRKTQSDTYAPRPVAPPQPPGVDSSNRWITDFFPAPVPPPPLAEPPPSARSTPQSFSPPPPSLALSPPQQAVSFRPITE